MAIPVPQCILKFEIPNSPHRGQEATEGTDFVGGINFESK